MSRVENFVEKYYRPILAVILLVGLYLTGLQHYLLFHSLAEMFSITVSFSIMVLAWNARHYLDNGYLIFLGLVNLFVGGVDLLHTLAFKGMNIFPNNDANLPTQLWLASRYIMSAAFLVAPFFLRHRFKSGWMVFALSGVTALLLLSIFTWNIFPVAYVEGQGLTPFKIASEYVIILINAVAIGLLIRDRSWFEAGVLRLIVASLLLSIVAEFAFTNYIGVYDMANMLGHYFKIIATYLLYKAIIVTGVVRPYDSIFRSLIQREQELQVTNTRLEDVLQQRNLELDERQHMIQALRDSQMRLRRLFESNLMGIMFTDDRGVILSANDALLNLIGYSQEELKAGQVNTNRITPQEYIEVDRRGVQETRERGSCTPYEKEFIRKDGARVPVLIGYALLENSQVEYVCFLLDLTRQKKDEQAIRDYTAQLENSNRELQEFAYVASHDLQEPLRKIMAFGDRLSASVDGRLEDTERDYLQRMLKAAARMRHMIDDLLALSRVTTKAQPFGPVDLNQIFRDVVSDLEIRIEQSGARVESSPLPVVYADALQMQLLFQNLIGNALKFRRPETQTRVQVSALLAGAGMVEVRVEDNGIGFDKKYLDRIFQPFQRLISRNEYEGSGMGLAIAAKIVERHHGKITADSRPGEGATFIITLPAAEGLPVERSQA